MTSEFDKKDRTSQHGMTRRDFLKFSAVTGTGLLFGVFDLKPIVANARLILSCGRTKPSVSAAIVPLVAV